MFLVITSCLLAMAVFISKLAESVTFFLAPLRTRAGTPEWLCSTRCHVPETFLAEGFAKIKMSLRCRQRGEGQTWKWGKIGFRSSYLEGCVTAMAPAQFSVPSTGVLLQRGQTRTLFLRCFSRRALPPTSLKWTCSLFLFNSSCFWGPDFRPPKYMSWIPTRFLN